MLPLFGIFYHSMLLNHIPFDHSNHVLNQFFHLSTIHNSIILLIHNVHNHKPSHIILCVFMCMRLLLGSTEIGRLPLMWPFPVWDKIISNIPTGLAAFPTIALSGISVTLVWGTPTTHMNMHAVWASIPRTGIHTHVCVCVCVCAQEAKERSMCERSTSQHLEGMWGVTMQGTQGQRVTTLTRSTDILMYTKQTALETHTDQMTSYIWHTNSTGLHPGQMTKLLSTWHTLLLTHLICWGISSVLAIQ